MSEKSLRRLLLSKWAKVAVFLICLSPLAYLGWRAYRGELTANPVEFIQHLTGDWTLRFLLITLSVTPLRRILNLPDLIRFRRMLGLFAFFYVCLHFLTYIGPDQSFDLAGMWKDVAKRPFITVGFLGFVLLIPLALTSTKGWIRRLGGKRWQALHRLIYLSALCGVVHYYWLVKSDHRLPLLYGAILVVMLGYRLGNSLLKPRPAVAVSTAP
ncbi:MAG: protein-methionine-sulfoxide reductase heme-binding subunit MsrQ [Candidatus Acidiferrum sp.]